MSEQGVRVLVVDDERSIRRFLKASLGSQFVIFEATTGEEALTAAAANRPDVIILDLGLPDMDGVEVTRRLREWTQIPIIVVSVREQEKDKIAALDAGADDYLTKPFSVGELMARLRSALRRSAQAETDPVFKTGNLVVDLNQREVLVNGQPISLTPTEYDLLRTFVKHAGKVLTHDQLLRAVWGTAYESETHMLQVNISNLRRKIEPDPVRPSYLITEPGVGYRLKII
ncbi:MAG: response regulator transcription factor [Chloroflexi bacterium]|nr:response regulator transcription factor [Chloroflexota bacterium]MBE3119740.1 response regulator transcription factor [Candidatus Atribacteria bacterium]